MCEHVLLVQQKLCTNYLSTRQLGRVEKNYFSQLHPNAEIHVHHPLLYTFIIHPQSHGGHPGFEIGGHMGCTGH